ncbi:MAG: SGNH/GDSL hydrolase family protein [Pirellulaceae bacterium]
MRTRRHTIPHTISHGVIALLAVSTALLVGSASLAEENRESVRVLFVGNSFTAANGLDTMVKNLIEATHPGWQVETEHVSPGGYQLADHLRDSETPGTVMNRHFHAPGAHWDVVVLQAQSQTPALATSSRDRQKLLEAAPQLARKARQTGATVLYFMTWGFPDGDPTNLKWYPDYGTLQKRLAAAYDEMAEKSAPAYVAPVGLAFEFVYEDLWKRQHNPLAKGSRFRQLYGPDSKHPSLAGSYLAAAVITASIGGQKVSDSDYTPRGLDPELAAYLRGVADRVVFGEVYRQRRYPWRS